MATAWDLPAAAGAAGGLGRSVQQYRLAPENG